MTFGRVIGFFMVITSLLASGGYFYARDYRQAIYFLFAAGINLTVIW